MLYIILNIKLFNNLNKATNIHGTNLTIVVIFNRAGLGVKSQEHQITISRSTRKC